MGISGFGDVYHEKLGELPPVEFQFPMGISGFGDRRMWTDAEIEFLRFNSLWELAGLVTGRSPGPALLGIQVSIPYGN